MLKGIRNRSRQQTAPRILILGLDNAGKTTILRQLAHEESDKNATEGPTQGFNLKKANFQGKDANFCDLGGQRAYRDFWKDYYEVTDMLMYVVDASDSRRIEEAHQTFSEVVQQLPGIPVLVYANKQDLATAKTPDDVATALQLTECRDRKWQIQGCSAKTGEGLAEGMEWAMENATVRAAPPTAAQ